SALMAVSAFSPYVYAEEETDVAAAAVEETAEAVTEEVTETVAETEEAADEAAVVDAGSSNEIDSATFEITYDDADTKQNITTIKVTAYDASKTLINAYQYSVSGTTVTQISGDGNATLTIKKFTAPTCEGTGTTGTISLEFVHTSAPEKTIKYNETLAALTEHSWKTTTNTRYVDADGNEIAEATMCIAGGFLQTQSKCSICGETSWTIVDEEQLSPLGHKSSGDDVLVTWDGANIEYLYEVNNEVNGDIVDSNGQKTGRYVVGSNPELYTVSGTPTLVNAAQNGYYYKMYTCANCGETVYQLCTVAATESSYVKIVEAGSYNIAAYWINGVRYIVDGDQLVMTSDDGSIVYSGVTYTNEWSTSLYTTTTDYPVLPAVTSVELKDCSLDGYYYVVYYNQNGSTSTKQKIEIAAHHMEVQVAVFSSQEDMDKCNVSYDDNGDLLVTTKSCYEDITYTKEIQCKAVGCASCENDTCVKCNNLYEKHVEQITFTVDGQSVTTQVWNGNFSTGNIQNCKYYTIETIANQTATHSGTHTYLEYVYSDLQSWIKEQKANSINVTTEYIQENYLDDIANAFGSTTSQGFKITDYVVIDTDSDTSTCTTTGTVKINFICTTCGKEVAKTMTVSVGAKGHVDDGVYVEEYVAATCESEGSYAKVRRCQRCGELLAATEQKTIQRLAHTNEISSAYNSTTGDYTDDTTNVNKAASIYLEFVGTKIVDGTVSSSCTSDGKTYASLLDAYNNGVTTLYFDGTELLTSTGDTNLGVQVRVYTKCTECGYEVELTRDSNNDNSHLVQKSQGLIITIDGIQSQDTNGAGGYVTLTATYVSVTGCVIVPTSITGTFNYYTSYAAYAGRVDADTPYDPDITSKNGVYLEDGEYRYYVTDEWKTSFSGIVQYNDGYYFVSNGVLCTEVSGLNLYNGTWYMLAYGKIQDQYTGVAIYDGEAFYLTNGVLDTSVTGLVEYDGATFLFCYGRLMDEVSGLWYYDPAIGGDGVWYYLVNGQVAAYSGAVIYDGAFFLVKDGKLASDYTGTYDYDGVTFNVVAGQFAGTAA
ncbi:MAG: hypothetical protein LUH00_08710, partial [Lachnospiraceae bacterium]|nr:hypothetical protein [Lachnospiraceae bacterium]